MNLGFITLGSNVPSTRFRFLPYLPMLTERGHRCQLWMSFPSVYEHFSALGWRASTALKHAVRYWQLTQARLTSPECIYLERGCLNDNSIHFEQKFRHTTKRLVLDIDDGIFLEQAEKIDKLLALSDHIIVSNECIAEYISARHDRLTLIPTVVSVKQFQPLNLPRQDPEVPVIGWMGTSSNMPFLEVASTALRQLAKDYRFELLVIGPTDTPLSSIDFSGVKVVFKQWDKSSEVQDLQSMDIGIMPLPTGREWMKYKAATKLVQYMAVGIPAVASPIGVNAKILANNAVGYCAADDSQWYEALRALLVDPSLRIKMGQAGRSLAEQKYSAEANIEILENVLSGKS
ncbi:MAG: glycosyltransferase [Planctomycetales bacterium]|nr:glycosyltransferase [Planctomycetales bacterium]